MAVTRVEPPFSGDERRTLTGFLDYQRATLELKCDGLSRDQLRERAVPPSSLSLLGLVRHLARVERNWFRRVLDGQDVPRLYWTESEPDLDFDGAAAADPAEALAAWREECAQSRALVDAAESLEVTAEWRGRQVTLRGILTHVLTEYSRHNGHADLLRERIDGTVGM